MERTDTQKKAEEFAEYWKGRGDEKQHAQKFWLSLLRDICGTNFAEKVIDFEERVKVGATKFIDGYIAETKTIIEQKGAKIDLDRAERQSDGAELTPFEQARRYDDALPLSQKARWIVVSNFTEIRIHDMDAAEPEKRYERILLKDLPREYHRLQFLIDPRNENIRREEEISIEAGRRVRLLYDALLPQYRNKDAKSLRSLNILCVRIVFCLYAEDAGLFEKRTSFEDYIRGFNVPNVRKGLIELFKALDTPIPERDEYDESVRPFPYVNGGLFRDGSIEIPNFTQEIVDVIANDCAVFDWSEISPTIFGAVFESTLNPDTRRSGGMHYTSIENIHKVIDPLFMDALWEEFESITGESRDSGNKGLKPLDKRHKEKLLAFQKKLGTLTFLDPACGSGNFLTETYLSLRRLENRVISLLNSGEKVLGFDEFIQVKISQFYGIEINDFAVTVAKTALWIAESQMILETEQIVSQTIDFLPLTTNAFIVEGNALRMDWRLGIRKEDIGVSYDMPLFYENLDSDSSLLTPKSYNYIMGNPPFVGQKLQSASQKSDLAFVFGEKHKGLKMLDYVSGWYKKSLDLIKGTDTRAALVSTNSICQEDLWSSLFEQGLEIDFAWRTFKWQNETAEKKDMAAVHCVIVGFSVQRKDNGQENKGLKPLATTAKRIFNAAGTFTEAKNINGYLLDAPNITLSRNGKQISGAPDMTKGAQLIDGGGFMLNSDAEKAEFLAKYPEAEPYVYRYYNAKDFLNDAPAKYCLYLKHCPPELMKKCKGIHDRIKAVQNYRANSDAKTTQMLKDMPSQFFQSQVPEAQSIVIPVVSSENRRYIPMCFMPKGNVYTNALFYIDNANLYEFGILTSSVHMAWTRVVCGRLEMRYRYSNDIVYNNFPFPDISAEQKDKIEKTAQGILDAREKSPNSSLAALYDELTMPADLRKAHRENDSAVMAAYGFGAKLTERLFSIFLAKGE